MRDPIKELSEQYIKENVRDALEFLNGNYKALGHFYWSKGLAELIVKKFVPEGEDPLDWSTRP